MTTEPLPRSVRLALTVARAEQRITTLEAVITAVRAVPRRPDGTVLTTDLDQALTPPKTKEV
jgi:hypothetical protein